MRSQQQRTPRLVTAIATALALSMTGCAGDGGPAADDTTSPLDGAVDSPSETATSPEPTSPEPTSAGSPASDAPTTAAPSDTSAGASDEPEPDQASDEPDEQALAGTPIDMFWHVGEQLAVVGVAADDVLNVRVRPGADQPVVGTLGPLTTDVEVVGGTRLLRPGGFWVEVDSRGVTGWVNVRYLAFVGETTDETSRILPQLPDDGRASTMTALGHAVAATETSGQTEPGLRVVVVDGPSVGDVGEITVDVIGVADDSVAGGRYHVFGEPATGGEGFVLRSVELTTFCWRGVTEDGLCI